MHFFIIDEIAS